LTSALPAVRQATSREVTLDISGPVAGLNDVGGVGKRDAR